jgi:hypothetical protein
MFWFARSNAMRQVLLDLAHFGALTQYILLSFADIDLL